jgi:hypothetical protein
VHAKFKHQWCLDDRPSQAKHACDDAGNAANGGKHQALQDNNARHNHSGDKSTLSSTACVAMTPAMLRLAENTRLCKQHSAAQHSTVHVTLFASASRHFTIACSPHDVALN